MIILSVEESAGFPFMKMSSQIQMSKNLLRKQIKEKLQKVSDNEKKKQTDFVVQQMINLPAFKSSKRISIYLSTANEIATESMVKKIFELNKQCFVPRYNGDLMQMVRLNSLEDWETLPLTKWNIKQPDLHQEREDAVNTGGLDLIIVPGVAFTKDGWRMGHGKGYYDTYLHKIFALQKDHKPTTVGVCFREQIVDSLPRHEHDVKLDLVIYSEHS